MKPFVRDNLARVLKGRKILLAVSGSIAAFKACDVIRFLRDCGATVRVVLTEGGERFVTPATLEALSAQPVLTSLWGDVGASNPKTLYAQTTHHIESARWADLILVAPASANTIARLASGLASDLLSTELLAFRGPVLLAPAMNPAMFAHPAVQANVEKLRGFSYTIVGPVEGITSCGEEGLGRMVEPATIVERVAEAFYAKSNGRRLLLTLGPTRSPIDPVRYITNRSSGLMGGALAWAAVARGYKIAAVCGPVDVALPGGESCQALSVATAREMASAVEELWPSMDVFISAAAVLDWEVTGASAQKLKKSAGPPRLEFRENPDILATAARRKRRGQYVVGFAAETENVIENGIAKLRAKSCDALFANDVSKTSQGFESDRNGGWMIVARADSEAPGVTELPSVSKTELAWRVLDHLEAGMAATFSQTRKGARPWRAPRKSSELPLS